MQKKGQNMKRIDRTNEENTSKYGHMIIIKYNNSKDIDVKFDNGYIALNQTYRNFINGSIINPMTPTVLGKGYYGIGKYVAKINGKHTKEYKVWRAMLNRCYGKLYQESHKTYENCEVCDEWLNFQVFAEWFHENYYEINGEIIDLDKDFLSGKTKIYSLAEAEQKLRDAGADNSTIWSVIQELNAQEGVKIFDFAFKSFYFVLKFFCIIFFILCYTVEF